MNEKLDNMRGRSIHEVLSSNDDELVGAKLRQLSKLLSTGDGSVTAASVQILIQHQQHQATKVLIESSERLERLTKSLRGLTWGLIALTAVLILLAIPPAIEIFRRL